VHWSHCCLRPPIAYSIGQWPVLCPFFYSRCFHPVSEKLYVFTTVHIIFDSTLQTILVIRYSLVVTRLLSFITSRVIECFLSLTVHGQSPFDVISISSEISNSRHRRFPNPSNPKLLTFST